EARLFDGLLRPDRPGRRNNLGHLGGHDVRRRNSGRGPLARRARGGEGGVSLKEPSESNPPRPLLPALFPLLVGGLLGFIGGYFAAGGGRPAADASAAESNAPGDRLKELRQQIDRDPQSPKLWTALGNAYYDREDWDHAIAAYEKAKR